MTTPTNRLPTITENSEISAKAKLSTLASIVGWLFTALGTFAAIVIFSYVMWSDVQFLKEKQRNAEAAAIEQAAKTAAALEKQAEKTQAILDAVKEIEWRQKYGVTTALPKTTSNQP